MKHITDIVNNMVWWNVWRYFKKTVNGHDYNTVIPNVEDNVWNTVRRNISNNVVNNMRIYYKSFQYNVLQQYKDNL
jgi:hypothetical protein